MSPYKHILQKYNRIIPEIIRMCEEFNRTAFSVQWVYDIVTETPEKYPYLTNLKENTTELKFREYTSKLISVNTRFGVWSGKSPKFRVFTYKPGGK